MFFLFGRCVDFDPAVMRDATMDMISYVLHVLLTPLHFILRYLPFGRCREMQHKKAKAWKALDAVIVDEILLMLREHRGLCDVHPDRKPGSALASLFCNEPRFYESGIDSLVADVRVFMLAGFETTAHGLGFAFGLLAEHPDIGNRIAQEARLASIVCSDDDYFLSPEMLRQALDKTPTARNLFLEAVRLFPLLPTLGGLCTDDINVTTSTNETYGLPKGTNVAFFNVALQRHAKFAKGNNPHRVEPDRWKVEYDDESSLSSQPFLSVFNLGAHACPGKPLSLLEAHVMILMAATRFEFRFADQETKHVDYTQRVFLRPKDGMPLLVTKRRTVS